VRLDGAYNKAISQIFSAPVASDLALMGSSEYISYVLQKAGWQNDGSIYEPTLGQVLDDLYNYLLDNYRSEYIFKNSVAERLLLKKHSLKEATLLSEFRAGISKADVVIINGTSTVYEIKTGLDNLNRLPSQLQSYSKVFDYINVVTDEGTTERIEKGLPDHVGLIVLREDTTLTEVRQATSNRARVSAEAIFDSMRKPEFAQAVKDVFGFVPQVPNTIFYSECKKLFSTIMSEQAHDAMVRVLRQKRSLQSRRSLLERVPRSVQFLTLVANLTRGQRESFAYNLTKTFRL
jgi:hypothetical protein